jgi:hypothetical protein
MSKLRQAIEDMRVILEFVKQECGETQTYILVTPDGQEIPAVLVSEETVFDATANDIRKGTVAVTDSGVTVGTKDIPSYYTSEGSKAIMPGKDFSISIPEYEYTKLQALICAYNTSLSNSVATEKVVINDNVYDVLSIDSISLVEVDTENMSINLGIRNETSRPMLIRYFTYKEVY